jgi:hypothetical protein
MAAGTGMKLVSLFKENGKQKTVSRDIKPEEWTKISQDETLRFLPLKSEWEEARFIKDDKLNVVYKTNRRTRAKHDFFNQRLINILVRDNGSAIKGKFKDVNKERTELDAVSKNEVFELKTYAPMQETIDDLESKMEKFEIDHINLVSPKFDEKNASKLTIAKSISLYRLAVKKEPVFKWFRNMQIDNRIDYHYRHVRIMDASLRFLFQKRLFSPTCKHTIENKLKKEFRRLAADSLIWKAYYSLNQFYDPVYEQTGRGRGKNSFVPAFDIDTDKHNEHEYIGHQYCHKCLESSTAKLESALKKLDNVQEIYFSGNKGFHVYTDFKEVDEKRMIELNQLLAPEADQFLFERPEGIRFDEHRIVKFPHSACGDTLCCVEPFNLTDRKIMEIPTTDELILLNK